MPQGTGSSTYCLAWSVDRRIMVQASTLPRVVTRSERAARWLIREGFAPSFAIVPHLGDGTSLQGSSHVGENLVMAWQHGSSRSVPRHAPGRCGATPATLRFPSRGLVLSFGRRSLRSCEVESPLEVAIRPGCLLGRAGRILESEPGLRGTSSLVLARDDGHVSLDLNVGSSWSWFILVF
jgi:hypothetical protein